MIFDTILCKAPLRLSCWSHSCVKLQKHPTLLCVRLLCEHRNACEQLSLRYFSLFFSGFWQIPSHHAHAVTPIVHVLQLCVLPDSIPSLFLTDKHTKQPLQQSSINSYMHTCILLCFQKASSCIQAPARISHSLYAHQPAPCSSTPRPPEHLWGRRVAFPVQVGNQESQGEQKA